MFGDVDDLKAALISLSSVDGLETWLPLADRYRLAFVAPEDVVGDFRALLPEKISVIGKEAQWVTPVSAAIGEALEALDLQPFETVYVTTDGNEIAEAASARVGTFLVGKPSYEMADLLLRDAKTVVDSGIIPVAPAPISEGRGKVWGWHPGGCAVRARLAIWAKQKRNSRCVYFE